jgi:hypothetical protein
MAMHWRMAIQQMMAIMELMMVILIMESIRYEMTKLLDYK